MTALSAPMSRDITVFEKKPTYMRVRAGVQIWKGARLTMTSGAVRPLTVADGAANLVGLADETVTGGAADGDVQVLVIRSAEEKVATIGTYTAASIGSVVYGLDDGTDLSHDATSRIAIGRITSHQGGKFIFRYDFALTPQA